MKQESFVGAGLEFTGGEDSGSGGFDGGIAGQERGLGFGVCALAGLGVGGDYNQQFGFNTSGVRKEQFCLHALHYFTLGSGDPTLAAKTRTRPGWAPGFLRRGERWDLLAAHFVFVFVDGGAGFAVGFAALFGFALVPLLLAFGDGQFAFHSSVAEIEAHGDERMSLDLRLDE